MKNDSDERAHERLMSWRREVYLSAAESVSRLQGLLGRVADLNVPDEEFSRIYQDDIAKISRIQVIASERMMSAINSFIAEHLAIYMTMQVDRAVLAAIKRQIDAATEDTEQARKDLAISQYKLWQKCVNSSFRLAPMSIELLTAGREDLKLPIDHSLYAKEYNRSAEKVKREFESMVARVDSLRAEE